MLSIIFNCEWPNIKEALPGYDLSELKPFLWKDEINEVFILTRYMEIYLYNKNTLRCYCWSSKRRSQLIRRGLILNEIQIDDPWYTFDSDIKNLPLLLALGKGFKRKPNLNGKWIKSKEKILGHKIIPFNPIIKSNEIQEKILLEIEAQKTEIDQCTLVLQD